MKRLGLIGDYIQEGDTSLGDAYRRYQVAFAAMTPGERAADLRVATAAVRALPHGERVVEQVEWRRFFLP